MKKVYIFLADGFEEIEALTVVDLLRRANIEIFIVSIKNNLEVIGSHNIKVIADNKFDELDFIDADMLVLPGGKGVYNLLEFEPLIKLLKNFNNENKKISAICAAPMILGKALILKNKDAVCYPGYENDLVDANVMYEKVIICENIITSRGPSTAIDFSLLIIKSLVDDEMSKKISQEILL